MAERTDAVDRAGITAFRGSMLTPGPATDPRCWAADGMVDLASPYDTQEDFRMSKALRVLITGAARGIGMATAQVLANRGHSVVATDISALSGLEGIQAHVLDVTSDDSVARCLEEVGPLDAIVNNAGIFGQGPV